MDTRTISIGQTFGLASYQGMAAEVFTCVNNLQSRCDILEDASAIFGCVACCSGIEKIRNEPRLPNALETGCFWPVVRADVGGSQDIISQCDVKLPADSYVKEGSQATADNIITSNHWSPIAADVKLLAASHGKEDGHVSADNIVISSQCLASTTAVVKFSADASVKEDGEASPDNIVINSSQCRTPNAADRKFPADAYVRCLRKRPAGSLEEWRMKKKGKLLADAMIECSGPPNTTETGPQDDLHKAKAAKDRKWKENVGKPTKQTASARASAPSAVNDGIDAKAAALEWQQCVSLLKCYGIIRNADQLSAQSLPPCVPHPGFVGDGLQSKMCKACSTIEDANNTVICDECQEAFHLSCVLPRIAPKYFKREDNWFCTACRRDKKKPARSKFLVKGSTREDNSSKSEGCANSSARLGPAHQAEVPEWKMRAEEDDLERCVAGFIGMEVVLSQEQKDAEKGLLRKAFEDRAQSLGWLSSDKLPIGIPENWVKCNNVIVRGLKDSSGQKHADVRCGKWRRAPSHVKQADNWECFCAIEWDPLHADCAVPQELPTEEVMKRISSRVQTYADGQAPPEVMNRKTTLRQGKTLM